MDVTDAYHRGTVKPAQAGAFAYVISSAPGDDGIYICTDMVLLMGWVDSPQLFMHVFGNADRCDQYPGGFRAPGPIIRYNL